MTITSNISLLAQSQLQSSRLNDLRSTMDELQRQITTQKKFDNFSGFGTDAISLQRLRTTKTMTDGYLHNIDTASSHLTLMNQTMTKLSSIGSDVIHAIGTSDVTNMPALNQFAQQSLKFVQELLNQESDGQYLFAGSDNTSQPFIDINTLNANFANQVNIWLVNAAPTANATLFNNTDGFTATQLGLSNGLAASGTVTTRIDQNMDIDYTVKADASGFKNLIRSLTFLSQLKVPDPTAGDVATKAQFDAVLDHIRTTLSGSIQEINETNHQLVGKFNLVKDIKEHHQSDREFLITQIDTLENTDPNTAIIQMQSLQTQMTASYQITRLVSQMSLVNFM